MRKQQQSGWMKDVDFIVLLIEVSWWNDDTVIKEKKQKLRVHYSVISSLSLKPFFFILKKTDRSLKTTIEVLEYNVSNKTASKFLTYEKVYFLPNN